jgi:hypothetical protein
MLWFLTIIKIVMFLMAFFLIILGRLKISWLRSSILAILLNIIKLLAFILKIRLLKNILWRIRSIKISLPFLKLKIGIIDWRILEIGLVLSKILRFILIIRLSLTTKWFFEHFSVQSLHLNLWKTLHIRLIDTLLLNKIVIWTLNIKFIFSKPSIKF